MAQIRAPQLAFDFIDDGSYTTRATASCWVRFTDFELSQIEGGLTFRVRCRIRGSDSWFNGADDNLYLFHPIARLPQGEPRRNEEVRFEAIIAVEILDEDDYGQDDIYARFELYNPFTDVRIMRNSPLIQNYFSGNPH